MCALQYLAAVNDTVIGIITDKAAEAYRVNIGGRCEHTAALRVLRRLCVCLFFGVVTAIVVAAFSSTASVSDPCVAAASVVSNSFAFAVVVSDVLLSTSSHSLS